MLHGLLRMHFLSSHICELFFVSYEILNYKHPIHRSKCLLSFLPAPFEIPPLIILTQLTDWTPAPKG